jgi:hypothetical protein
VYWFVSFLPFFHKSMHLQTVCSLLLLLLLLLLLSPGHTCHLDMDGFYAVSFAMACLGLALGLAYLRLFPRLTKLPLDRWRAKHSSLKTA